MTIDRVQYEIIGNNFCVMLEDESKEYCENDRQQENVERNGKKAQQGKPPAARW